MLKSGFFKMWLAVITIGVQMVFAQNVEINETNFPDPIFRVWVNNNLAGGRGFLTPAEIERVTSISVSGGWFATDEEKISNLIGIEHFTALRELFAHRNKLISIDVSNNVNLRRLVVCDNQLSTIDVSNNVNLERLEVNNNQLSTIDVSNNVNLRWLEVCDNQLSTINLSNIVNLERLEVNNNQLSTIDVSNNVNLERLEVRSNQLTTIDVSNNVNLSSLSVSNNQLTTIDVSNNVNLRWLGVWDNQLTTIDVSNNVNLSVLSVDNNQLTAIDVSNNVNLSSLSVSNNQLTTIDVTNKINLMRLEVNNNQLTAIDISNNVDLVELNVSNNQLSTIDVSNNVNLKWLKGCNNQLTAIDISKNVDLIELEVSNNQLATIDVSNNVYLWLLKINNNQLTAIDVSNNVGLCWFSVNGNFLPNEAAVIGFTGVWDGLYAVFNPQNADITDKFTDPVFLAEIYTAIGKTPPARIFVSDVDSITVLNIAKGRTRDDLLIRNLDGIEYLIALRFLDVSGHDIKEIDLSNNTELEHLDVSGNQLQRIDITHNIGLRFLNVEGNRIASENDIIGNIEWIEEFIFGEQKPVSIINVKKSDKRYGIRLAQNIVSERAEMTIVLPSNERIIETKIVIYDMTGNVVHSGASTASTGSATNWDLRNSAGRFVANGTYLVIAEVRGASGMVYAYSARLGVKRQ